MSNHIYHESMRLLTQCSRHAGDVGYVVLLFGNATIMDDDSRALLKHFLTFKYTESSLIADLHNGSTSATNAATPLRLSSKYRRFPFLVVPALYTQWEDPSMATEVAIEARRFLKLTVKQAEAVQMRVAFDTFCFDDCGSSFLSCC